MTEFTIQVGDEVTVLDLDEFFPCRAGKWDYLIIFIKNSPHDQMIAASEFLCEYCKKRRRKALRDAKKQTNSNKRKHFEAQARWFERKVKILERLIYTA